MSVPMRKEGFDDEEITTADLAQSKRPVASEDWTGERAGPVLTELPPGERAGTATNIDSHTSVQTAPETTPLFPSDELDGLRNRWNSVQAAFVDEPRRAVEQADALVASAMKRLAEVFSDERKKLEQQLDRGDNISTEDLRIALQRYRSFFHRLLSV
jgi:hypothetical protein